MKYIQYIVFFTFAIIAVIFYFLVTTQTPLVAFLSVAALIAILPFTLGKFITKEHGKIISMLRDFGTNADAVITDIQEIKEEDRSSYTYISYKFSDFQGKEYSGGFEGKKDQSRFSIGDVIKIKYNPEKPSVNDFAENLDVSIAKKEFEAKLIETGSTLSPEKKEKAMKMLDDYYGVKK